jgi:acetyltransferase-like isoleucine patch superfamily enzyme
MTNQEFDKIGQTKLIKLVDGLGMLLFWLRWFYPRAKGMGYSYLLTCFFPQKILRINGRTPWPVHFTSRVFGLKNISVGNNTAPGLSPNNYIQGRCGIIFGNNVRLGPGVGVISANHALDDYDMWQSMPPIVIGDNVWIGMNAVVMPGTKIGNNVVIGANSVVTNNIPDDSIAAGVPCKVIGSKRPYTGKDYSK